MSTKKVLFPTDFTRESLKCMKEAIAHCEQTGAELIVLYTYRLIKPLGNTMMSTTSIKRELDDRAKRKFEEIREQYFKDTPVPYQLLSEVGFMLDRVAYHIEHQNIDQILICDGIYQQLKSNMVVDKQGKKMLNRRPVELLSA